MSLTSAVIVTTTTESGNYISSDPIGLSGGERPFGYVGNPLDWVDLFGLAGCKGLGVKNSGHHVPSVRKSKGRPFKISRNDKTRPTLHPKGNNPENAHWRLHDAERGIIGPRQGDFIGTDAQLFDAYRKAYENSRCQISKWDLYVRDQCNSIKSC